MALSLKLVIEEDVPYSNIARIWMPIFEWYVVSHGSKSGHQKDMSSKESRLRAQNMLPILDPIVKMIRGAYVTT